MLLESEFKVEIIIEYDITSFKIINECVTSFIFFNVRTLKVHNTFYVNVIMPVEITFNILSFVLKYLDRTIPIMDFSYCNILINTLRFNCDTLLFFVVH